ncbi:hypothetical protein [Bradyrhizobium sp. LTSP857]|uniref:hypothetical protein n=1 Tax=Bradyrhizobium sp. LTSP857 TaxID=1619231 RepID=UPI0018CE8481|nr:hypothetical protein [Bradyrhizobium sp. LTSP857]
MIVNVDQARHHQTVARIDGARRRPAYRDLVVIADVDDAAVCDGHGPARNDAIGFVQGDDKSALHQEITGARCRCAFHG